MGADVLGNFILAFTKVLEVLLSIAYWLILIRALISWVSPDPFNPIVQFLYQTTEPILVPIRRMLPMMSIDLSPIIAFILILFVKEFLVRTLFEFGMKIKLGANV
ncbi:MAG: YggT family protein [Candidatus Omnitrophica bacterium]|nr:YggT family protein [Candidatus Omnitrophota bacterium]